MQTETPICVLDACVIYPAPLRDILLNLADQELFRPRWSSDFHEEWTRNLLKNRPDLHADQLAKTVKAMNESFDGSVVEGYSYLIEKVTLPDLNDRHVLACAIQSEADIIITANKKDFPKKYLSDNFDITVYSPDEFISNIAKQSPQRSITAFRVQVGLAEKLVLTIARKQAEAGLEFSVGQFWS